MTTLPDGIELRAINPDEFERWARQVARQFGEDFHAEDLEYYGERRGSDAERTFALLDGSRLVGTGVNFSFTMTVPGGVQLACAGVSGIGVQTTHRRRGLLRAMMRALLDDARERGEPLAALLASESHIYGRFGFGPAITTQRLEIRKPYIQLVQRVDETVELIADDADALARLPAIYDRVQRAQPGMLAPPHWWWPVWARQDGPHHREGFSERFRAFVGDRGYVQYRTKADWSDTGAEGHLRIDQLLAVDTAAAAALWQFCFDVDLMTTVTAGTRPPDDALPLQMVEPVRVKRTVDEPLYLRLLNLPVAMQARSYALDGELVFDVHDGFCPENSGRWALEVGDRDVGFRRTDRAPDLRLSVEDLASLYLGGVRCGQLVRARRVEQVSPQAALRADLMFTVDPLPWQPWHF